MVRLDHFRGLEAYWEVPAGETTARNGRWVKGPGAALFEALQGALGELPIVAENLGVITPEVEAIRTQFGFPGMAILQFAFGKDPQAPDFKPHNYPRDRVAYTGHARQRHDRRLVDQRRRRRQHPHAREDIREERDFTRRYLATRRARDPLGLHPDADGVGGQYRVVPPAGRAGPGQRGAHEHARRAQRQLALALSRGDADSARSPQRLKEMVSTYDR